LPSDVAGPWGIEPQTFPKQQENLLFLRVSPRESA